MDVPFESNQLQNQIVDSKWIKAAIVGSTWAAFEIIVGSFLHNIGIPFAGTFLSMASVILLISYLQLWDDKGLVLRAGIICALMKSISPSALILGPMIGIFMEALVIQGSIFLFGRNIVAYIIGGSLAVTWALIQKALNYVILYGTDIIAIANSIYSYLMRVSMIENMPIQKLVSIILIIYVLSGSISAVLGYIIGKKLKNKSVSHDFDSQFEHNKTQFFNEDKSNSHSSIHLLFLVLGIAINLYLLNAQYYLIALLTGFLFLFYCYSLSNIVFKKVLKRNVILQFGFLSFSLVFLSAVSSNSSVSIMDSVVFAMVLIARALIMIVGFAALAGELRNPLVKNILYKRGFRNLYNSLNIAFMTLPAITEKMPERKDFFSKKTIKTIFSVSLVLLNHFEIKQKQYFRN